MIDPLRASLSQLLGSERHVLEHMASLLTKNVLSIPYQWKYFHLLKCWLGWWSSGSGLQRLISLAVYCVFMIFLQVISSLNINQDNGKTVTEVTS